MTKSRVSAIVGIFIATTIAWFILGLTIVDRTQKGYQNIGPQVQNLWGNQLTQLAPVVHMFPAADGKDSLDQFANRSTAKATPLDLSSSDITANMKLEYRRKGLLWFSGYMLDYAGSYSVTNPSSSARIFVVDFTFPSQQASYDEFIFTVDGKDHQTRTENGTRSVFSLAPGQVAHIKLGFKTRGMGSWSYSFGEGVTRVQNFQLVVTTDFGNYDFPDGTISPQVKRQTGGGSELTWKSKSLLSSFKVGVTVPQKLNPGELAARIAFFAPLGLFFFFLVMIVFCLTRRVNLHPIHFLFLSAGFFVFQLLFTYLVDHVSVTGSFLISALVSLALVVNYIRMVTGLRFALFPTAFAQIVYLVLFSYAFFFKGFTGLTITIGTVITLALLMQVTGKIDWERTFTTRAQKASSEPPVTPGAG